MEEEFFSLGIYVLGIVLVIPLALYNWISNIYNDKVYKEEVTHYVFKYHRLEYRRLHPDYTDEQIICSHDYANLTDELWAWINRNDMRYYRTQVEDKIRNKKGFHPRKTALVALDEVTRTEDYWKYGKSNYHDEADEVHKKAKKEALKAMFGL